ncbi:MAG: hypothetical protein JNL81_07250 [Hyphomonadaceae bacterium]|nr:hypothetical protein [Hyphomonadaceae bacterium]
MRKLTLLAAAAALMTATPAAAEGYLGVQYNDVDEEVFGLDVENESWKAEGAWGWNNGNWGAQVGAAFGSVDTSGGDEDYTTLEGHLYWQSGSWRVGGFATNWDFASQQENAYGVEGMYDFGEQWNVSASYAVGDSDVITDLDTTYALLGGNFYLTPDVRFGVNIGQGEIESTGGTADLESYGLNTEFKLWSAPVSVTLAYDHFETDDPAPFTFGSDVVQVGARWNFGGGTLRERNNATPFEAMTHWGARLIGTY